ncbi:hypothetical protein KIN20_037564 [Parelaphostrongylus tenuis]|uniref:Uncharacterized protein n=1 Tax=Parelaphostrongylus tenuis TaxID=148309 RepID=A0AAD5RE50_PARTN|nr:hypothetical protein KIN20_037564 [Parelaphostrongylus tenuis]
MHCDVPTGWGRIKLANINTDVDNAGKNCFIRPDTAQSFVVVAVFAFVLVRVGYSSDEHVQMGTSPGGAPIIQG